MRNLNNSLLLLRTFGLKSDGLFGVHWNPPTPENVSQCLGGILVVSVESQDVFQGSPKPFLLEPVQMSDNIYQLPEGVGVEELPIKFLLLRLYSDRTVLLMGPVKL